MAQRLSDFRDYGEPRDWAAVSAAVSAAGAHGAEFSAKWIAERAAQVRATGRCDGCAPRSGGRGGSINPYDANAGQRLAAGGAGTGKSFVIHAMADIVRNLLGCDGDAKDSPTTGVAPFQVGGPQAAGPYGFLKGRKNSAISSRWKLTRFAK